MKSFISLYTAKRAVSTKVPRIIPSGPPHIVESTAKHSATVIFLHGLGDAGETLLPVVDTLKTDLPHIKWVLPNAPKMRVSAQYGMTIPAWFNIFSFDWKGKYMRVREDNKGLLRSAQALDQYIQDEVKCGIPSERIVLAGFSEGGALSLLTALTVRHDGMYGGKKGWRIGGVAALSAWLPTVSPHLWDTPVFMGHGISDARVPLRLAELSAGLMSGLGARTLIFKQYVGVGHEVSPEMLPNLNKFLSRVLPQETS